MSGMDTAEIRVLANNIRAQANGIQSVVGNIDGIVAQLGNVWHGPDATALAGWWQSQHRPALVSAESAVAGLAQSADNRAKAQDDASGATGGGSVDVPGKIVGVTPGDVLGVGVGVSALGGGSSGATGSGTTSGSSAEDPGFGSSVVATAGTEVGSGYQAQFGPSAAAGTSTKERWTVVVSLALERTSYTP